MTLAAPGIRALGEVSWRQEVMAGVMASVVTLPVCLAAGVLVFAPLGPGYLAAAAAAGLAGAIVAGVLTALIATSSFIITSPRINPSLVQASLVIALLADPVFAGDPKLIVVALALCILLAGIWQILFGLFGVAAIVKFTPHPVLAGFLNGVALTIVASQLKPLVAGDANGPRLTALLFVCGVAAFIVIFQSYGYKFIRPDVTRRIPASFAGLIVGMAVFYAAAIAVPDADLGRAIGRIELGFSSPLARLFASETMSALLAHSFDIVVISLVLAIVATIDALLTFRTVQNLADVEIHPVRDLAAQGVANCGTAVLGGICAAASPPQSIAAYSAGGRTRWTGVSSAVVILLLGSVLSQAVGAIPNTVLSAILVATGLLLFDRWSFTLLAEALRDEAPFIRRRAVHDLLVVIVVMGTIVTTTVVAGVLVGCLLAGVIFIINMSRPVVRRNFSGHEVFSKRIRPVADIAILRESGPRRVTLQLEGVLFFGNADDLAAHVKRLYTHADMIALDLRAVSDIDVSGAHVLRALLTKSRERHKHLFFCNVPPALGPAIRGIVGQDATEAISRDLDSTLEWMEELTLAEHEARQGADRLRLDEIDFLRGLGPEELKEVEKVMTLESFKPGDTLCREGDAGDRMWLLLKGCVSVRLAVDDHRGTRRIASLARGTTVGEMALIEETRRSASIVADEEVVCYELDRDGFNVILRDHPTTAAKLLANLARELTRRLRRTSEDLRQTSS